MKVICKNNSGKFLSKAAYDIGNTEQTIFHINIGQEYRVYGMALWNGAILILIANNDTPHWYPLELFSISDAKLPDEWCFTGDNNEIYPQGLWGYEKLVNEPSHYEGLIERTEEDLAYFKKLCMS